MKSLIQLAQDFRGMTIQGAMTAVIIVPASTFNLLVQPATDAGVNLDDRTQLELVVVNLWTSVPPLSAPLLVHKV
jgi:hypothetical protein